MFPRTNNRKAISTVLTTLIILVASVVLGTGVVLYGTSLFQTGAQSEGIATTGTQLWVDSSGASGWAWGAADIRNSGDKLLSIDSIQIRGQQIPFANWYADTDPLRVTNANFQSELNYTSMLVTPNSPNGALKNGTAVGLNTAGMLGAACPAAGASGGPLIMEVNGHATTLLCLIQQAGPVSLAPGTKTIVYFKVPVNILTSVDAGTTASVAIYAGKVGSPVTVTVAAK